MKPLLISLVLLAGTAYGQEQNLLLRHEVDSLKMQKMYSALEIFRMRADLEHFLRHGKVDLEVIDSALKIDTIYYVDWTSPTSYSIGGTFSYYDPEAESRREKEFIVRLEEQLRTYMLSGIRPEEIHAMAYREIKVPRRIYRESKSKRKLK